MVLIGYHTQNYDTDGSRSTSVPIRVLHPLVVLFLSNSDREDLLEEIMNRLTPLVIHSLYPLVPSTHKTY